MKARRCSVCRSTSHDRRFHEARNPDFITVGGKVVPMRSDKHEGRSHRSPKEQEPYKPHLAGDNLTLRQTVRAKDHAHALQQRMNEAYQRHDDKLVEKIRKEYKKASRAGSRGESRHREAFNARILAKRDQVGRALQKVKRQQRALYEPGSKMGDAEKRKRYAQLKRREESLGRIFQRL